MSAISRVAKTAGKYASRSWQQLAKAETQGTSVAVQQFVKQSRSYASGMSFETAIYDASPLNVSRTKISQRISYFFLLVHSMITAGGGHHDSVTHAGVTIHKAAKWHVYTGEAMAGLMWYVIVSGNKI